MRALHGSVPALLMTCGCAGGGRPVAAPPQPATIAAACGARERRQLDFWLGEWDLIVHARKGPASDEWIDARATQRITAILGGCAISEEFAADGPGTPWAGRSYSSWQPAPGVWRQTWVDDQGGYLAFTGGLEDGVMTLYGEPREQGGQTIRMRMVFLDVAAETLRWEWQRSAAGGPWTPMLVIDYRRRR